MWKLSVSEASEKEFLAAFKSFLFLLDPPVLNQEGNYTIQAMQGETIDLDCFTIKGYPLPSIVWLKDDEKIVPGIC